MLDDDVLVLNSRPGPKWYHGVITKVIGVNVYEGFVNEMSQTWMRHSNQLLASSKFKLSGISKYSKL